MSRSNGIPAPAVRRLSLYLRHLEALRSQERLTVSSRQLGEALGLTDAQVRKDLAHFGQFGHPGVGYRVEELITRVRRILGTDRTWNVLLVGAGNLGRALVSYRGFTRKSFHVVAVFDADPRVIGTTLLAAEPLTVRPMNELPEAVQRLNIHLAILAVPADCAQDVADRLIAAGIRGILNFAPVTLRKSECALAGVDLAVHLEHLSFQLASGTLDDALLIY